MKKLFAGSVALVVTALIATSLSPIKAVAASSVDESSVDALKKEISRLRQENAALRKRAAQQDSARSNTATTPQGGPLAMATGMPVKGRVAQPVALPHVSGYIEMYSGAAWSEDSVVNALFTNDFKYNGWVLGGAGRGNWWATENI